MTSRVGDGWEWHRRHGVRREQRRVVRVREAAAAEAPCGHEGVVHREQERQGEGTEGRRRRTADERNDGAVLNRRRLSHQLRTGAAAADAERHEGPAVPSDL